MKMADSKRETFEEQVIEDAMCNAAMKLGYSSLRPKQVKLCDGKVSEIILVVAWNLLSLSHALPKHVGSKLEVQGFFMLDRDVFVSLPTGSGKSLCYCILPAVFDILREESTPSIVVVVSPLIALMKDQVRSLLDRGVPAVYVGGIDQADICSGKYQLVYMS